MEEQTTEVKDEKMTKYQEYQKAKNELRNMRVRYKEVRNDYKLLCDNIRANVEEKKRMREEIKVQQQKMYDLSPDKEQDEAEENEKVDEDAT